MLNGKYHLLPLASLLVKLLTNNGIFFFRSKRAHWLHISAISITTPCSVVQKRGLTSFFKSSSHLNSGTIFIRFSRLAYPPAEDRRDGPSKPLSSGECWAHTTKTRCAGTASLPCDNKTRPVLISDMVQKCILLKSYPTYDYRKTIKNLNFLCSSYFLAIFQKL